MWCSDGLPADSPVCSQRTPMHVLLGHFSLPRSTCVPFPRSLWPARAKPWWSGVESSSLSGVYTLSDHVSWSVGVSSTHISNIPERLNRTGMLWDLMVGKYYRNAAICIRFYNMDVICYKKTTKKVDSRTEASVHKELSRKNSYNGFVYIAHTQYSRNVHSNTDEYCREDW